MEPVNIRSDLEYEIYVPDKDKNGSKYDPAILETTKKELATFFGGMTDTTHANKGIWKTGGVTMIDEVVVWKVLSDKEEAGDLYIWKLKKTLEILLRQEEILIVRRKVDRML